MRKQDYYEPSTGCESEPRRRPKKKKKRTNRGERAAVTLLSLLFLVVAAAAVVKYVVRAPEPDAGKEDKKIEQDSAQQEGGDGIETIANGKERKKYCYTILLSGVDNDAGGSDTNMLMRFDAENDAIDIVSLPRDSLMSNGHKLNYAYNNGGTDKLRSEIEDLLGVPVDFYVSVNLKGFVALIDQIGGIEFDVPCDMDYDDPYQNLFIHFKQGQQHLNGQQAMEVARFRKNNDGTGYTDVGRTQTQQKLLIALAKKVLAWNSLSKINGFVEIFNKYVTTNMEMSEMMYFASQAVYLDTSTGVETDTLQGNGDASWRGFTYCYELDPETTLDTVNRLLNPYEQDLKLTDMNLGKS